MSPLVRDPQSPPRWFAGVGVRGHSRFVRFALCIIPQIAIAIENGTQNSRTKREGRHSLASGGGVTPRSFASLWFLCRRDPVGA